MKAKTKVKVSETKRVILKMSETEAGILLGLIGNIGGQDDGGVRAVVDAVWDCLFTAGVGAPDTIDFPRFVIPDKTKR